MSSPLQWTKQVVSHFGGTRNPLGVHWPNGIKAKGELRTQFHHIIASYRRSWKRPHIAAPSVVNGIAQKPMEGVSMMYSFDDANAKSRRCSSTAPYTKTAGWHAAASVCRGTWSDGRAISSRLHGSFTK
jgi:arylsulfatase A-like enzyme